VTSPSLGRVRKTTLYYGSVCTLSSCNQPRVSGNKLCNHHRKLSHFRGDPEQPLLSKKALNFSKKAVKLLILDNERNDSWLALMQAIGDNWVLAQGIVNRELARSATGVAMNRYRRNGLKICHAIFSLGLEQAFTTYVAFQFLEQYDPKQFKTEISFRHLLVRHLRNQAKDYRSSDISKTTGKPTTYSSLLYVRERDTCWETLSGIFGITGMLLFKQVSGRAERLNRNKNNIYRAIKDIT
jgi:hypothetical protein